MRGLAACVLALLLASCAVAPRTSTEGERQSAMQTLLTVETALVLLQATQNIEPADFQRAMATLADLRKAVEESEHKPFDWSSLTLQVANLAARWVLPVPPPATEGPQ